MIKLPVTRSPREKKARDDNKDKRTQRLVIENILKWKEATDQRSERKKPEIKIEMREQEN